jgi:hypothetical protein
VHLWLEEVVTGAGAARVEVSRRRVTLINPLRALMCFVR